MWVFEDFSFFFSTSGVICKIGLENQRTVTGNWVTQVAMNKFLPAIQDRRPSVGQRGIHLHMNNTPAHTALATKAFLDENGLKTLPHPPHSPDLSPCDFWLFPVLKDGSKAIMSWKLRREKPSKIFLRKLRVLPREVDFKNAQVHRGAGFLL